MGALVYLVHIPIMITLFTILNGLHISTEMFPNLIMMLSIIKLSLMLEKYQMMIICTIIGGLKCCATKKKIKRESSISNPENELMVMPTVNADNYTESQDL